MIALFLALKGRYIIVRSNKACNALSGLKKMTDFLGMCPYSERLDNEPDANHLNIQ